MHKIDKDDPLHGKIGPAEDIDHQNMFREPRLFRLREMCDCGEPNCSCWDKVIRNPGEYTKTSLS